MFYHPGPELGQQGPDHRPVGLGQGVGHHVDQFPVTADRAAGLIEGAEPQPSTSRRPAPHRPDGRTAAPPAGLCCRSVGAGQGHPLAAGHLRRQRADEQKSPLRTLSPIQREHNSWRTGRAASLIVYRSSHSFASSPPPPMARPRPEPGTPAGPSGGPGPRGTSSPASSPRPAASWPAPPWPTRSCAAPGPAGHRDGERHRRTPPRPVSGRLPSPSGIGPPRRGSGSPAAGLRPVRAPRWPPHPGRRGSMRDADQHRRAQPADELGQGNHAVGVQVVGGFVQQQHLIATDQDGRPSRPARPGHLTGCRAGRSTARSSCSLDSTPASLTSRSAPPRDNQPARAWS